MTSTFKSYSSKESLAMVLSEENILGLVYSKFGTGCLSQIHRFNKYCDVIYQLFRSSAYQSTGVLPAFLILDLSLQVRHRSATAGLLDCGKFGTSHPKVWAMGS